MIDADQVTAVIVTRGDVDLDPILATLPYEVVVWDNSVETDLKVYGRYAAIMRVRTPLVYFQDDDVIFIAHRQLLDEYDTQSAGGHVTDTIVANMDAAWVASGHYEDMVMVGAGSICHRDVPERFLQRYASIYPLDDLFLYECDFILGTLAPWKRVDLGYAVRDDIFRDGSNRLCDQPWQEAWKAEARRRARGLRELERA